MTIEGDIFKRYTPDFEKLEKYGFKKNKDCFLFEKLFKNNLFRAAIIIKRDGTVSGTVFDLENNDEFLPLRVENNQGAFVGEIRACYEEILKNIREKCFIKEYFIYPQTNRIAHLIIEKYKDKPEFLWEKFPGSAIFRNSKTGKWYFVILDVDRSKIQQGKKGLIEAADIKLSSENINKLTKEDYFYPGYHMNKKYWLTVILDDTVPDEKIMELVEESYLLSAK